MRRNPKYNNEGYPDPTAYEALKSVTKAEKKAAYKPLVYICSPFSGDGDIEINIANARVFCRYAIQNNYIPFAAHLLFPQFMNDNDPKERELAILMNKVFLDKCDELWVFGNVITRGMNIEIKRAKKKNIKIRYFGYK